QEAISEFVETLLRLGALAELVNDHSLEQWGADRAVAGLRRELEIRLTAAQQGYADLILILEATNFPEVEPWKQSLKQCCRSLLVEVDQQGPISIDLESFTKWMDHVECAVETLDTTVSEIIDFSIRSRGNEAVDFENT
ncbi:MAG: hypothetical protein EA353_00600, partial [Puniceicoccaceae bacterium]